MQFERSRSSRLWTPAPRRIERAPGRPPSVDLSFRRIASTASAGRIRSASPILPQGGGGGDPLISETFVYAGADAAAKTAAWRANSSVWNTIEGTDGQIAEDPGGFYGTRELVADATSPSGSGWVLQYNYPDCTGEGGSGDTGRCANRGLQSRILVPNLAEVWIEITAKFSNPFDTSAPGAWSCSTSADFKFVRTVHLIPGTGNITFYGIYTHPGGDPNKMGYDWPGNPNAFSNGGTVSGVTHVDGNWHTFRIHSKIGANGIANFHVDDTPVEGECLAGHGCSPLGPLVSDELGDVNVNATEMYAIMIGATMNQGAETPSTIRWGSIKMWNTSPGWL